MLSFVEGRLWDTKEIMSEEESITVSIPYYHYDFAMPWAENREMILSDFLLRAVGIATQATPFGRYSGMIMTPPFGLYIPGQAELPLEVTVESVLSPGGLVLILTTTEARRYLSQTSATSPSRYQGLSVSRTPFLRGQIATINALLGTLADRPYVDTTAETEEDDEASNRDEEYVGPNPSNLIRVLDFMNEAIRNRGQQPLSERVKKVINLETFTRVCKIVTQEEIKSLTTESSRIDDGEDDTIDGPRDAGLGGCSVCLSLLVDRSKSPGELRKMPVCNHIFHSECLEQWLTHNAITCPVCREAAVSEQKDYGYLGLGINPEVYTPATSIRETPAVEGPSWLPNFNPRI